MRGLCLMLAMVATAMFAAESPACDNGGGGQFSLVQPQYVQPQLAFVQPQVAYVQPQVQYQVQQFAVQKQFVPVQKQVVRQRVVRQQYVAPVVQQQVVVKQRKLRSRSQLNIVTY